MLVLNNTIDYHISKEYRKRTKILGQLFEKLIQYSETDYYPYHMPGHKRTALGSLPKEIADIDITEIDGFDNLHQPEELLKKLQEEASRLYGAEETFYLINGSTCGILSAISAAVPDGGHILIARNSHKSTYHAIYLKNLTISYLYPQMHSEYDIMEAITPEMVAACLEQEPHIDAVFVVSPTYEGRIADIKRIAEIVHKKGIPLIVDEAHGAHLGMADGFAPNSCQAGADLVIHSVHKTLPAMTQTALLHVNGSLIQRDVLKRYLHIYQSSSPSYVLMASIDNALHLVKEEGEQLFAQFYKNYKEMLQKLQDCQYLQFLQAEDGVQDIGKLVIFSGKSGLSGKQIYDILLQKYHLQLEMCAGNFCLAMFTIADKAEAYERMTQALLSIDAQINAQQAYQQAGVTTQIETKRIRRQSGASAHIDAQEVWQQTKDAIPFARAWDMPKELIPLKAAIGRRVGEFINLYPPGIPLLVPGEVLEEAQYRQIMDYIAKGLTVQGLQQGSLPIIQDNINEADNRKEYI